jgi:hypothetical protein
VSQRRRRRRRIAARAVNTAMWVSQAFRRPGVLQLAHPAPGAHEHVLHQLAGLGRIVGAQQR